MSDQKIVIAIITVIGIILIATNFSVASSEIKTCIFKKISLGRQIPWVCIEFPEITREPWSIYE